MRGAQIRAACNDANRPEKEEERESHVRHSGRKFRTRWAESDKSGQSLAGMTHERLTELAVSARRLLPENCTRLSDAEGYLGAGKGIYGKGHSAGVVRRVAWQRHTNATGTNRGWSYLALETPPARGMLTSD